MAQVDDVTMTSEQQTDPGSPTSPPPADESARKDGEQSTKWKHYPLRDKIRVVDFLRKMRERDHGHPEAATIAYFEKQDPPIYLTRKTIHKWEESRDKLIKALEDEENGEPARKRPRKSKNPAVEAQLVNFCKWAEEQNIPVTGPLLKQKLKIYQERLGGVELVGSNGWLQAFYGYYGIKLAGCKELKAAQRAAEDAEFSDDPDGKKRRLRKRRAAAKRRRANAKLAKMGGVPQADNDNDDDDDDDDDDEDDDEQDNTIPPSTMTARAPPAMTSKRPAPRPTARKTGAGAAATSKRGTAAAKAAKQGDPANSALPRTTSTMQIEHLTQQHQPDPMMHWDNGSYQADYGDMDESGDDDYYPPAGFGSANQTTASTADQSGWTVLDTDKINDVRNAATTLLGLALERSDVGLDNVQQNMISILEWCRRQEDTLSANLAAQAATSRPATAAQSYHATVPSAQAAAPVQAAQHTTARLPAQYASTSNHTPQAPATSQHQTAYAPGHGYSSNQYSASTYSTLASAAAAAATGSSGYQLPHTTAYPNSQSYHTTHTQSYPNNQTYSTQYAAQGYPSSHTYSARIGL